VAPHPPTCPSKRSFECASPPAQQLTQLTSLRASHTGSHFGLIMPSLIQASDIARLNSPSMHSSKDKIAEWFNPHLNGRSPRAPAPPSGYTKALARSAHMPVACKTAITRPGMSVALHFSVAWDTALLHDRPNGRTDLDGSSVNESAYFSSAWDGC
jgi:hypothetical protein